MKSIWNSKEKGQLQSSNFFHSDQDLMGCILHVRCVPHHNSIRQVWASVHSSSQNFLVDFFWPFFDSRYFWNIIPAKNFSGGFICSETYMQWLAYGLWWLDLRMISYMNLFHHVETYPLINFLSCWQRLQIPKNLWITIRRRVHFSCTHPFLKIEAPKHVPPRMSLMFVFAGLCSSIVFVMLSASTLW